MGRVDIAKLCLKYGYVNNVKDAFNKYLIDAYNKTRLVRKRISYQECLDLIINSNGIPVLAHPKSLELDNKEFLILIKKMIECGLMGIEVYHPSHTQEEIKYYEEIALKYNLLIGGGSDFHGNIVKPNNDLGMMKIKSLSLVDYLEKR